MVCSVFHRKWQRDREKKVREVQENLKTLSDSMSLEEGNKKKRKKSPKADRDGRDNSFEVSSDTKRDDNENLIMVGGIAGLSSLSASSADTSERRVHPGTCPLS